MGEWKNAKLMSKQYSDDFSWVVLGLCRTNLQKKYIH